MQKGITAVLLAYIEEVPICFNKRMYGVSKRRLIPFIIDYAKSLIILTTMRIAHSKKKLKL